jgi:hypothetical protein
VILLFGVLLVMKQRPSAAQTNSSEEPPRHVEIKMVAPDDTWPALETVLSELLARLQVGVRFSTIPSIDARQIMTERSEDPPSVARVWIDMREQGRVTLFLTGDRADRLLVRHVPLVARIDEVAREEIAHIVEATVDALLVGGRIGVVTDEPLPPREKAEPPAAARERGPSGIALDLGIAYEAQAWQPAGQPLHSAAVVVGVAARSGTWRPSAWISGEYRFPAIISNDLVSARLDQGAFRAVAALDWAASRKWVFGAGAGGGFDLVRIAPDVNQGPLVDPTPARYAVVPMLRLALLARYAFTARSEIFAGFAADYDLLGTRYILRDAMGADVPVFEPWRLRPTALIGVTSDVLAH